LSIRPWFTLKIIFSWEEIPFLHNPLNPVTARAFILKREEFASRFQRNTSEMTVLLLSAPSEMIPLKMRGKCERSLERKKKKMTHISVL